MKIRIINLLRQLYLLLWKNYVLKKRKKLRFLIEIVWPLCLFLILVWLRSEGFRSQEPECHFTERPLPSSGILPFFRAYFCELNNSCSQTIRGSYYDYSPKFTQLTQITSDYLDFTVQSDALTFLKNFTSFFDSTRAQSSLIANNLTFEQIIKSDKNEFVDKLKQTLQLNDSIINSILNSVPNYNYLYSNYSETQSDSLSFFTDSFVNSLPQSLINSLYGSSLAFIDYNRIRNHVNNSTWIRKQLCFDKNYLLIGSETQELANYLCNQLNESQLEKLFTYLSEELDVTRVKEIIGNSTFDENFFTQSLQLGQTFDELKQSFTMANLTSLDDINKLIKAFKLKDICDSGSQLNIFTLVDNLNLRELKAQAADESSAPTFSFRSLFANPKDNTDSSEEDDSYANLITKLEQMNNLNKTNTTKCTSANECFCADLFNSIEQQSEATKRFFSLVKPLITGKILYAPNTTFAYNKLIEKVNTTFTNIDKIAAMLQEISLLTDQIFTHLNESIDMRAQKNYFNLTQSLRLITELTKYASNLIRCYDLNRFIGFKSEKEAIEYGVRLMEKKSFWAAIVFPNVTAEANELPKLVKYKIRMDSTYTHDTAYIHDRQNKFGASTCQTCNKYFMYGFIYLQDMLEKAIVEMKTNQTYDLGITAQMTPYPCWVKDKFITKIIYFLPLFMSLAWIFFVSMTVKDIVQEKEKRLKEFMHVMGLTNIVHWLAWFITSFLMMFFISIILCIIIKYGKIMSYSDISVLIVFFGCFTAATVTECFLISVFFNRANLAAVVGGILYFTLYLPFTMLVQFSSVLLPIHKMLFSLSSTVAFGYGIEIIGILELEETGIQWSNFNKAPGHLTNSLTLNQICFILLFDAFVYTLLTLYVECVAPGEYGIAKPWYFVFNPFDWMQKFKFFSSLKSEKEKIILAEQAKQKAQTNDSIESVSDDLACGIEIDKLNKVYSRGNNHALKGLSIKFYKNEITAFLGHNGAGKSTTMHILTGLYMPTSGTAKINDLSIKSSMNEIRKSLGFVPQHNILFDLMTVEEHLWFYSRLKGLDNLMSVDETKKMLDDTGLEPKRNEYSKNLSGGMQRKLSVAIAFVAGSKTVILDEPSAGVDPSGRRDIWDMLLKYRSNERTIIISTHHMDEADVLGDRIAIISNGRLIAHGTSYFLKQKFGRGYYLTFAKKKLSNEFTQVYSRTNSVSTDSGAPSLSSFSDETSSNETDSQSDSEPIKSLNDQDQKLYEFVKKRFKSSILIENVGSEMTFSVSNQSEHTRKYEKYFSEIEANMSALGIDSMGISDTTLEEIFIKIAKEPESNKFKKKQFEPIAKLKQAIKNLFKKIIQKKESKIEKTNEKDLNEYSKFTKLRVSSWLSLIFLQFYALFMKRMHRVKRNIKGFFAEIVLPIVFVCLALLVATLKPNSNVDFDRPMLELHPWYYSTPNKIFLSKSSAFDYSITSYSNTTHSFDTIDPTKQANIDMINKVNDTFFQDASLGTRCMRGHHIKELNCAKYNFKLINKNITFDQQLLDEFNKHNYSYTKKTGNCMCTTLFPFSRCENSSAGDIKYRPVYELKSKDILYDLTSRNVSDWLIKTEFSKDYFHKRYGGYEFLAKANSRLIENVFSNLVKLTKISFDGSNPITSQQNLKIWYNLKGYLSSVAYLNLINNAVLRSKINYLNSLNVTKEYLDPAEHGIVAYNHPMKFTKNQFLNKIQNQSMTDLFVAICIIFALSFIPASFLVFLLEERENQSKQLQFISGVKPYLYWITNYILDLINYIIPCVLCIFVFLIFDVKAYLSKENLPCLIALIFLYGWSSIPFMYPLNYLFKLASTAFVITSCLNVFIGIVTVMTINVLKQLSSEEPYLLVVHDVLKPMFIIFFPHYCLGQGFIQMSYLYNVAELKKEFGVEGNYDPFEFNNNGRNLLAMFIQGIVYFTLNILIQYNFFIHFKPESDLSKLDLPSSNSKEDDDVARERLRILNDDSVNDYVKLKNVTKIYKRYELKKCKFNKHVAVNDLCLGIQRGECFGLIGINGAGKTTTFKMITGEIQITAGDIYIGGSSVSRETEKVHKNIGYCPQFDALMPLLTAKEQLIFFARLRGIPEKYVEKVTEWAINRVGLNVFADRISGDFSGGNKRKLSTAIALIGDPSVILLDEPTSGMDAKARRLLWNDILSLIRENRIVILTSHSMEECEALCTRLVIMVNGKFKCLGSPQHLRSKFGTGIKLAVRLNNEHDKDELFKFMIDNFNVRVEEAHKNLFEFIVKNTKLSELFGKIERNRDKLKIKDYSVNQTTLDQIFINFARENIGGTQINDDVLNHDEIEMEHF